ncbi:hypothetical protein HDV02_004681 [Globomyces sp. JEL0801]|nr:hypothetical protein HDV02_004681 [Globomyces sp. JEL0801]
MLISFIGGFGGHPDHDPHLLFTLSAVQILVTFDALDVLDTQKTVAYGSFAGDSYGETDTRFSYCAISCASLLKSLHELDITKAVNFGSVPGAESHAGQMTEKLGWWLAERQLENGGLNGRPEKLEDVCYSWWVLSSLDMIGKKHWIDEKKLIDFILKSQVKITTLTI